MTARVEVLRQIARAAELRESPQQRRADGSFFTDADVARHLARRAIAAWLLTDADAAVAVLDGTRDPIAAVVEEAAAGEQGAGLAARITALEVLDPTCGAGSFLIAAWDVLLELEDALGLGAIVRATQLHGVDRDASAVAACTLALADRIDPSRGRAHVTQGDALEAGVLPAADILLGNPPYVRAAPSGAPAGLATRRVPNVSAWIVERALSVARPGARAAFVLPISTVCTDAFEPARQDWMQRCSTLHASHFDTIPSTLFAGVVQRLTIIEGQVRVADDAGAAARWWTTRYHRWTRAERAGLLQQVRHVEMPPQRVRGSLPKIGTAVEAGLLATLMQHAPAERLLGTRSDNRIWYKRRWSYFLLFTDFVPPMWDADGAPREPTEFKPIDVDPRIDAQVLLSVYSSTLFWWYFSVFTDNRNVNRRDLEAFPVPELPDVLAGRLAELGSELMEALRACAEVRTCTYRSIGTIRNTYFRQGATRPVIDAIDAVLAEAYGMDDEQLAFVLGYERRFRGGAETISR